MSKENLKSLTKKALIEEINVAQKQIICGRDKMRKLLSVYMNVIENTNEGIDLIESGIDKISEKL